MEYNVYRKKEVDNYQNDNSYNERNSFVFALISFFLMLFMTSCAPISSSFGIYYGLNGKNKVYLIANIMVLITSLINLLLTFSQVM